MERGMSTTEREAQREDLRERIVEAARDIVSEQGLDALSMRALGLRIGHSPGRSTIISRTRTSCCAA
jgi:AcrR family transcriptional regulator